MGFFSFESGRQPSVRAARPPARCASESGSWPSARLGAVTEPAGHRRLGDVVPLVGGGGDEFADTDCYILRRGGRVGADD